MIEVKISKQFKKKQINKQIMANFKIKILLSTNGDAIRYKLDETNGFYRRCNAAEEFISDEKHGLYDILLGRTAFSIIKVIMSGAGGLTFEIGDRISETVNIDSFVSKQNKLFINGTIDATTVRLYVPPTPVRVVASGGRKINNFKDLQSQIENTSEPIKLGNKTHVFTHNTNESLQQFLTNFILTYNKEYNTCYVNTGRVQTETSKRRSLGDIYMICKYYYPTCNLHDVIQLLYVTMVTDCRRLGAGKCSTILKRVWFDNGTPRFTQENDADEYGTTREQYIAKLNSTPVYETNGTVNNDGSSVLSRIKQKYPIGTKIKSIVTGKVVKINNDVFYDGVKSIILVQRDEHRIVLHDKITNEDAKIVS